MQQEKQVIYNNNEKYAMHVLTYLINEQMK